jgi:hypothetical protein
MRCRENKITISLVSFLLAFAVGFGQETPASDKFVFKTEVHVDLLFHALAHIDLGDDDANLYSEGYVGTIHKEKQALGLKADLKDRLDAMKGVFISEPSMGGLRMIDFLPFYITDYNEFIDGLNWLATDSEDHHKNPRIDSFKRYITRQEQREFIKALSGILDEEYRTFYRDHWKREQERLADVRRQFEVFVRTNGGKLFSPVMSKEKKGAVVYLCLSMTRWGRGFSSKDRFGAAVKFPEKREEFLGALITAVHEMTHQFSDALVMKAEGMDRSQSDTAAGSEGYRVHLASEYGVIYAEYLLFRKFLPEHLNDYCLFFLDAFGKDVKDRSPEELDKAFRAIIDLSEKSIAAIADYINKL